MTDQADYSKTATPTAHHASHENGGSDEISVAALSGLLADLQSPLDHTHQSAGSGVGGKLDHGQALTGLTDNDHPQYVLRTILTTVGDIPFLDVTGWNRLPPGNPGQVLKTMGIGFAAQWTSTPSITFENSGHTHQNAAGGGQLDHGLALTGLTDDDHTQYALLAGRAGGQTLYGGNAANDDLTIEGTSNSTRTTSYVLINPDGGNVGIGTTTPTELLALRAIAALATSLTLYSTTTSVYPISKYLRSHSDTVAHGATVNNELLAGLTFQGNSGTGFTNGAYIIAMQVGAAGTYTPTQLRIGTSDGTNNWTLRMAINPTGEVGIKMTPTYTLDVTGNFRCSTGFGCNGTTPQTAYASGGPLTAYAAGTNGLDTEPHMSALHALVVAMRAALVANGIMS